MFASKDFFQATTAPSGYQLTRSLRFRASASAYLNRTFGTPTDGKKWTYSCWFKRGVMGTNLMLYDGGASGDTNNTFYIQIYPVSTEIITMVQNTGGVTDFVANTSALFRDPSSWYHFVFIYDTTNATSTDRMQFWVNGVKQTLSYTSGPAALNTLSQNNKNGSVNYIGRYTTAIQYLDGYLGEINFIDGQALTPSSFGQTDAATGVWVPKKYTGTYGTNGFYLPFTDTSSTTNLVKDSSGNANNWTPNNISLTAGTTYDSMIDVPYCTGQTGGTQPSGNYATFNPLDWHTDSGTFTIVDGNLKCSLSSSPTNQQGDLTTQDIRSQKIYFEFLPAASSTGAGLGIGVFDPTTNWVMQAQLQSSNHTGAWGIYAFNGNKQNNSNTAYGSAYNLSTDYGMCAVDTVNGKIWWVKNGTWFASGDPAAGTNAAFTNLPARVIPYAECGVNGENVTINFGQRPFSGTVPSGFTARCSPNLAAPTIKNGAGYMAATTYTGTGATKSVTNTVGSTSFQPDLVWIKSRSAATNHDLFDSVRGATKYINSNTQTAQTTDANTLTAFASNGFTLGSDASSAGVNVNAATYVGWQWLGSNTTVSNTSGTITSTVCVNTTSGISIITYTGNGTLGATIGHGLGVAPDMVINKQIASVAGSTVYHKYANASPATGGLFLESTSAFTTNSGYWNNTAPTSTLITLGQAGVMNNSGVAAVVYAFATIAGYSAFGSYTGNNSFDGPFVYCGFRPRFVMIKDITTAGAWWIGDSSRATYNVVAPSLFPNNANAESSAYNQCDFVSNGFKWRADNTNSWPTNISGDTYIYAAFAENPFNYSLAR